MIQPAEHEWRRAKRCANTACVEVAKVTSGVLLRGTAEPERVLFFTEAEWVAFIGGVEDGDFTFDPA